MVAGSTVSVKLDPHKVVYYGKDEVTGFVTINASQSCVVHGTYEHCISSLLYSLRSEILGAQLETES